MSEKTVLLIDDSATIRRLVDSELSSAGYRVVLAPTAEEGLEKARKELPDLIILDHQLPGTTGYDVCRKLLEIPETSKIPVVASSTLRKKAYSEYVDCSNVVDMLPKPYTAEVLIATVESAIDTGAMVIHSQSEGSSVPEVIDELGESDFAGTFSCFGLREVIDMLNNGSKRGVLEVQSNKCRVYVYLDNGRIQAVTATGIEASEVAKYLPLSLAELAPVIKFTISGRRGSETDGLAELLDNKVLDPRLLKKLLRLQAAILLRLCYSGQLKSFRFEQGQVAPSLFRKLPLDISQLALLVEGAMTCQQKELPDIVPESGFVRRAIRGQNLDRAGLSTEHMKLMGVVNEAITIDQISKRLAWPQEEVRRVVHGFELAELIERRQIQETAKVFAVAFSAEMHGRWSSFFKTVEEQISGKLLRDWLALGLMIRRQKPGVLLVELKDEIALSQLQKLQCDPAGYLKGVRLVTVCATDQLARRASACEFEANLRPGCSERELLAAIVNDQNAKPQNQTSTDSSSTNPFRSVDLPTQLVHTSVNS